MLFFFSTRVLIEDTIFTSLLGEWTISLLCPVIIRATYRSTEQFVGQGNSVIEPLFNKKTEKSSLCRFFHLILLTLNGQIWLFFDEKWIFVKSLGTF